MCTCVGCASTEKHNKECVEEDGVSVGWHPRLYRMRAVTCDQIHHNTQFNRGNKKFEESFSSSISHNFQLSKYYKYVGYDALMS